MNRGAAARVGGALVAAALTIGPAARAAGFGAAIEEHRLANGLRVVLSRDDALPDASVVVRYGAGSGDDPNGLEGLAHVTEHVLFRAFRRGAHAKLLLAAGATHLNAQTAFDYTWYIETVPPGALDLALWLEAARMATATDSLDGDVVASERAIATHEYRQLEFDPFTEFVRDELFPAWHPYHSPSDLQSALDRIGPADVRAFAATWYGPNDATVVVSGRFDPVATLERVERYFGAVPSRPVPARPPLPTPPAPGNLWLDVGARVTHPFATIAWRAPPVASPETRALEVAARLLVGQDGLLQRQFVEDDGAALAVEALFPQGDRGSALTITVEPRAGGTLEHLVPAVQAVVNGCTARIGDADVARVTRRLGADRLANLETSLGRALRLASSPVPAGWGLDDYASLDRLAVADAMRRYLGPEQRVTLVVRPTTEPLVGVAGVLLHRDRLAP